MKPKLLSKLFQIPQLLNPAPPAILLPWLRATGSLTQQLEQASNSTVTLQSCAQNWVAATAYQANLLHIKARQKVLNRRVILACSEQPAVYAESLLPAELVLRSPKLMSPNTPLGKALFAQGDAQRLQQLYGVCLTTQLPAQLQPYLTTEYIWLRQSIISHLQLRLIVVEYFLYTTQPWW